jgi:hypothetical protein
MEICSSCCVRHRCVTAWVNKVKGRGEIQLGTIDAATETPHIGNSKIYLQRILNSTWEDETLNLTIHINLIHTLKII